MARLRMLACCTAVFVAIAGCGDDDGRLFHTAMGLRVRGVIEGFFGPPYTVAQRASLFGFLAQAGLNTYVYAPKDDPFHRQRWREPYPQEHLEHFRELVDLGQAIGVRFVFALSPGLSFEPQSGDPALLRDKLLNVFAVGVRDFCLLFDDLTRDSPAVDADVQADLVLDTFRFLRALDPQTTLCFISNYYAGTAEELQIDRSPFRTLYPTRSSATYGAYGRIPAEVAVMWTGPRVFTDRLTVTEARRFRDFAGRPVLVWDNYPVNDAALTRELFLGPYRGREPGLSAALDGILINPMLQPEATKIPLWTVGRFFATEEGYDPTQAWEEALQVVSGGEGVDALRTLARQFQSHPFIGDTDESPELAQAVDEFLHTRSAESREDLRELLQTLARNRADLEATLGNVELLAELREPSHKLSLLGEAALLALDLLERKENGEAVDLGGLEAMLNEAQNIPWLPGANTPGLAFAAPLLGERAPNEMDVFGHLFDRLLGELAE